MWATFSISTAPSKQVLHAACVLFCHCSSSLQMRFGDCCDCCVRPREIEFVCEALNGGIIDTTSNVQRETLIVFVYLFFFFYLYVFFSPSIRYMLGLFFLFSFFVTARIPHMRVSCCFIVFVEIAVHEPLWSIFFSICSKPMRVFVCDMALNMFWFIHDVVRMAYAYLIMIHLMFSFIHISLGNLFLFIFMC